MSASATTAYLDIYIGNREEHDKEEERYKKTKEVLKRNAVIYGFPDDPEQLSVEEQEILKEVDVLPHSVSLSTSHLVVDGVECRSRWTCCSPCPDRCWLDDWCLIWIRRRGCQRR